MTALSDALAVAQAPHSPRFIVATIHGYNTAVKGFTPKEYPAHFRVLDRWYCHRLVQAFDAPLSGRQHRFERRVEADALCDSHGSIALSAASKRTRCATRSTRSMKRG